MPPTLCHCVQELMDEADTDNSGNISMDEFIAVMKDKEL